MSESPGSFRAPHDEDTTLFCLVNFLVPLRSVFLLTLKSPPYERQVFLAPNVTRALDLAGNLGFSVALVDLDLPAGAGFDLIRTLRRSVPDLQIIAVTNAMHSLSPEDAQKLGVVEVLKKPITAEWKPVVERIRARRTSG